MPHIERMRHTFPRSLGIFLATGVVMLLQMIPMVGFFLVLIAAAPLWSVALINAGMVGVAYEALARRVARAWLLMPLAFYGGYYAFVLSDHITLSMLGNEVAVSNAAARMAFDPQKAVVVAKSKSGDVAVSSWLNWLVRNFNLPVFYTRSTDDPEAGLATRMIDAATCAKVRKSRSLVGAGVRLFGFQDEIAGSSDTRSEKQFCMITQPERPTLPEYIVMRSAESERIGSLRVDFTVITVAAPDGHSVQVRGGRTAPLRWFPMPVMGCFLNSSSPSWECDAGFLRADGRPLNDAGAQGHSEALALADALGLTPVSPENRRGADPAPLLAQAARTEADVLAADIAELERIVADPTVKVDNAPFRVLGNRLDALTPRADAIMLGLERAAKAPSKAEFNGRHLARLLSLLPRAPFEERGPRILALYAGADTYHWLWKADTLVNRLGDLGPEAIPLLVAPATDRRPERLRSIEAACRLGQAGRPLGPLLQRRWTLTRDSHRREREELFVAMRRMGIDVPLLSEDKRGQGARIAAEWADIGPNSPTRVCATQSEKWARSEAKRNSDRPVGGE